MKPGFLITARLKSTRLAKKIILPIAGKELIRWMIDRLKLCLSLSNIIICTSTSAQDDPLEQIAVEEKIDYFRGSEDDVLVRLRDAANLFKLDYVVNITADCPLVAPEYVEETIRTYKESSADYITMIELPHGFYSFGLSIPALQKVCEIKKGADTEVWGRYFTDTGLFRILDVKPHFKLIRPRYRLTIDYPEDYEFFKAVFAGLGDDTYKKTAQEIVDFLDQNPRIVDINAHCEELYKRRWESQRKLEI